VETVPVRRAGEQLELIDTLAERVQQLGGVAIADPGHVAELTRIERAPNGVKEVGAMLARLLSAHETSITALVQVYDGTLVSLAAWYDNELGFANRLAEVSQRLAG
jgi:starvation-inducible DNA-binding protein